MIEVRQLNKTFKVAKRASGVKAAIASLFHREITEIPALQDLSFSIAPGEIVGYIGPNGAGKSTTIKIMSGILVPDSGECRIQGFTPWLDRMRYVRSIGVVFGQRSQLWWDVPVIDSFELLRDIYRVASHDYHANLKLLTEALNLGELLHIPVRQLSLGQRMRCEIAASLLHNPSLLFLDEPTIGLDAASKVAVRQFIQTINRERGVTVILTTHDMNDIEMLAQRVLLIGKGHLLYDGNLDTLRRQYGNTRTLIVDYHATQAPPKMPNVEIQQMSEERLVLSFDPDLVPVSAILQHLSSHAALRDVHVASAPIEEVILQLYKEHQIV